MTFDVCFDCAAHCARRNKDRKGTRSSLSLYSCSVLTKAHAFVVSRTANRSRRPRRPTRRNQTYAASITSGRCLVSGSIPDLQTLSNSCAQTQPAAGGEKKQLFLKLQKLITSHEEMKELSAANGTFVLFGSCRVAICLRFMCSIHRCVVRMFVVFECANDSDAGRCERAAATVDTRIVSPRIVCLFSIQSFSCFPTNGVKTFRLVSSFSLIESCDDSID